jgi:alpha-1,3-glucosyltransferase
MESSSMTPSEQGAEAEAEANANHPIHFVHVDYSNQPNHPSKSTTKTESSSAPPFLPGVPTFLGYPNKILPPLLVILTCIKLMLISSSVYRSTDFDVHRNWLAITHHLPLSEWYFNDINGQTVHTLDYPPAFAFFEYILANYNPLTTFLLKADDRCLDLLPDDNNIPSDACVAFQRLTVILSDVILWVGAYFCCHAMHPTQPQSTVISFLLIVFNPALVWLDHIHFQYNGMLLGILLASIACLMMGNHVGNSTTLAYDVYHLAGASLFALLLNLKHLYLFLSPLYFCYLLERYCLTYTDANGVSMKKGFLFGKFFKLALVTSVTLVLPWVPFLMVDAENPQRQLLQILSRLFPFDRGLLHNYWAANVWALYTLADKVVRLVLRQLPSFVSEVDYETIQDWHLPMPSPLVCAIVLFLSMIPGLQVSSSRLSNVKFMEAVVYSSLCSFMLSYHVHEKAILTAILPMTVLVQPIHGNNSNNNNNASRPDMHNVLFWNTTVWGLLGLFPLLYRPVELVLKLCSYIGYLGLALVLLNYTNAPNTSQPTKITDIIQFGTVAAVIVLLECVPIHGKWEFLPLMTTSVVCAYALVGCWGLSLRILLAKEEGSNPLASS